MDFNNKKMLVYSSDKTKSLRFKERMDLSEVYAPHPPPLFILELGVPTFKIMNYIFTTNIARRANAGLTDFPSFEPSSSSFI
jgi:hypothetical protein